MCSDLMLNIPANIRDIELDPLLGTLASSLLARWPPFVSISRYSVTCAARQPTLAMQRALAIINASCLSAGSSVSHLSSRSAVAKPSTLRCFLTGDWEQLAKRLSPSTRICLLAR